jgi:hypothetical protein
LYWNVREALRGNYEGYLVRRSGGEHFAAAAKHARSPGHVLSLWLTDGSLAREYSILIPQIALPPVIRDKNRMR